MSVLNPQELEAVRETVHNQKKADSTEPVQLANLDHRFRAWVPLLESATRRFAGKMQGFLTRQRKRLTRIAPDTVDLLTSAQMHTQLESTGVWCLLSATGGAKAALFIDAALLFEMTDRTYGGETAALPAGKRVPSRVELRIAARFASDLVRLLREASEGSYPELTFVKLFERNEDIQEALGDPPTARLSVSEDNMPPMCALFLPRALLDSLDERVLTHVAPTPADGFQAQMREALLEAPVDVVVELGQAALSLGALGRLAVGDVLRLDRGGTTPLDGRAEGLSMFRCRPTNAGQALAEPVALTVEVLTDVAVRG